MKKALPIDNSDFSFDETGRRKDVTMEILNLNMNHRWNEVYIYIQGN